MAPSIDWLLDDAIEIAPNVWRADSPLPDLSRWPFEHCDRLVTHADDRGPRLVVLEPDVDPPRALCLYPCEMGITSLDPRAHVKPAGVPLEDAKVTVVAGLAVVGCDSRNSKEWERIGFEAYSAGDLVFVAEDYPAIPMSPAVKAIVLAISRGEGSKAAVSPTDLLVIDEMYRQDMADIELLRMIRDDQALRFLTLHDEVVDQLERRGLKDIALARIEEDAELRVAARRAEKRRRVEGLE